MSQNPHTPYEEIAAGLLSAMEQMTRGFNDGAQAFAQAAGTIDALASAIPADLAAEIRTAEVVTSTEASNRLELLKLTLYDGNPLERLAIALLALFAPWPQPHANPGDLELESDVARSAGVWLQGRKGPIAWLARRRVSSAVLGVEQGEETIARLRRWLRTELTRKD